MRSIRIKGANRKGGRNIRLWETREWKQRREEFLKGKTCQWCGTDEKLVMHNQQPPPSYSSLLRKISSDFLEEKVREGEFTTQKVVRRSCPECYSTSIRQRIAKQPPYKCQKCRAEFESPMTEVVDTGWLTRGDWERFWGSYGPEIKRMAMDARRSAEEESLATDNYVALCNRCHMAARSGMTLCPRCKVGYMRPGREMCWMCFKKTDEGREVARLYEKVAFTHPWCGSSFEVERRWLSLAEDPLTFCMEMCKVGPENCPYAKDPPEVKDK